MSKSIQPDVKIVPIKSLKPYELNAKKHSEEKIAGLAEMIKRFGFDHPIVIDKKKTIIAGHARLEALKKLGMTDVPCIQKDKLSDEDVKAYRYLDNKIAESPWDFEKLALDLPSLDFDFNPFNVKLPDFGPAAEPSKRETDDTQEFIIVIKCKNEKAQKKLFEELKERGLDCRLVM